MTQHGDAHEGRSAILAAIERVELGHDEALGALDLVFRQLSTRAAVHTLVAAAGYELTNTQAGRELELYGDLLHGHRDVAFVAKGWGDPGFRVGDVIDVPMPVEQVHALSPLHDFAATRGVSVSIDTAGDRVEVQLEQVLFTDGFSASTLAACLSRLRDCKRRLDALVQEVRESERGGFHGSV
jgi:hypothetical protein